MTCRIIKNMLYILVRLLKIKDKETSLKSYQKKRTNYIKRRKKRIAVYLSSGTIKTIRN
jgi:hypothetical protein